MAITAEGTVGSGVNICQISHLKLISLHFLKVYLVIGTKVINHNIIVCSDSGTVGQCAFSPLTIINACDMFNMRKAYKLHYMLGPNG